jgi:hypothetical protein
MKIVRRRDEPGAAAPAAATKPAAPAAAGGITPKVLVRAAAPAKVSKEEEDSRKVAQLLGKLSLDGACDGASDVKAAVAASGFGPLQVRTAAAPAPWLPAAAAAAAPG